MTQLSALTDKVEYHKIDNKRLALGYVSFYKGFKLWVDYNVDSKTFSFAASEVNAAKGAEWCKSFFGDKYDDLGVLIDEFRTGVDEKEG